jgi:lipid-binding SYLF domain-containing protein
MEDKGAIELGYEGAHRVVKGFMIQGGDPVGHATGVESVVGSRFAWGIRKAFPTLQGGGVKRPSNKEVRNMRVTGLSLALLVALSVASVSGASNEEERLVNAAKAFGEIMSAPDKGIPGNLLEKADCVVIIPGMKKGGFIVGGRYGKGLVSCRNTAKTAWGAPAMLEMGGGSFGLQIGASAVDVVMLVMERGGMDSLLKDKFTLGADASVAAGPVGRATTAETDAAMKAKILSYSRSHGVFAGLELSGASLNQDGNANKALYGREIDAPAILGGKVTTPGAAKPVVDVLTKYSPKGK